VAVALKKVSSWSFSVATIIPVWREPKLAWVLANFDEPVVEEIIVVLDEPIEEMISTINQVSKKVVPKLTILENSKRMGIGYAIRQGLLYCKNRGYDVVVIMAGNGKDNPKEIPKLLKKIEEGYDYVQGSRFLEGVRYDNLPLQRRVFNRLWPLVWSILTGIRQTEVTNGFRAYKLKILDNPNININQEWLNGYALEYYIHYKALTLGYKYVEVPVSKIYPKKGRYTKINPINDWHSIILPPFLLKLRIRR